MLKASEIGEICNDRGLERKEVYNIRSEYMGLALMS
jgi:hypothetical protein